MEKLVIGIDFHKTNTQICVVTRQGRIQQEKRISSEQRHLAAFFANLEPAEIGIEISGGVFHIVKLLKQWGHKVRVLKPDAAKPFRRRGKKSDREDAHALCKALLSGVCEEVHDQEEGMRELKALLSSREMLIKQRVMLMSHLRGLLREFGAVMPKGKASFFSKAGKAISSLESGVLRDQLYDTLSQVEQLEQKETHLTRSLTKIYGQDERVKRLQTMPGVGPITSLCLLLTLSSPERFENGHQASSDLGLCPRQNSSGEKQRFGNITKAGCSLTRRNLIHGARAALVHSKKPDPIIQWARNIRQSQAPTNVKVVALASKMARLALALLKKNEAYDAHYRTDKAAA